MFRRRLYGRDERRSGGSGMLARLRRSDRAATLAFTAVAAAVLLGAAALAVDLGMLISARVQSQRAADSGALAGAQRLAVSGATPTDARTEAKQYANNHNVLTNPVAVVDGDVDVDGDTVRVRVHHRLNTLFARVLGIDHVDVSTVAAAEAVPSSEAVCPLPIIAIDGWSDDDADGLYDSGEYYEKCEDTDGDGVVDNAGTCTGFNLLTSDPTSSVGSLIEVKSTNNSQPDGSATQTCGAENPSWYCWIGGQSAAVLKDIINDCQGADFSVALGEDVESSQGNMQSLVTEIKKYIDNNDPGHFWNGSCVSDGNGCVSSSKRIRPLAVGDPEKIIPGSGPSATEVNNLMSVFMDKVASDPGNSHGMAPPPGQWNVYLRVLGAAQGGAGAGGAGEPGSLLQTIVLIE